MKICRTCKLELPEENFGIKYKHYLQPDCKVCKRLGQKERTAKRKSWVEANRDKVNEAAGKWRKKFPERANALNAKARSRKLQASIQEDDWLNQQMLSVIYLLAQTLSKESGVVHEVDHIVPLSGENVCGLHYWKNLQVIPMEENRRKSNKF